MKQIQDYCYKDGSPLHSSYLDLVPGSGGSLLTSRLIREQGLDEAALRGLCKKDEIIIQKVFVLINESLRVVRDLTADQYEKNKEIKGSYIACIVLDNE